jgi:hypothetical protein
VVSAGCASSPAAAPAATTATAASSSKANVKPKDAAGKSDPGIEATERIGLAERLVEYGRVHRSPDALNTAASLLAGTSTSPMDAPQTESINAGADAPKAQATTPPAETPATLRAEAAKMPPPAAPDTAAATRGAVGGPKFRVGSILGFSRDVYHFKFRGGEFARAEVVGDGSQDLDCYVKDEQGNIVAKDDDPGDDCTMDWIPAWSGYFFIIIENRGSGSALYRVVTN